MTINNLYFKGLLLTHKKHISKINNIISPFAKEHRYLFKILRKECKELALFYSNFKCEKCGGNENLTLHHLIKRDNKKIMSKNKYAAIRHYFFNCVILCYECHSSIDYIDINNMKVIDNKKIERLKERFMRLDKKLRGGEKKGGK